MKIRAATPYKRTVFPNGLSIVTERRPGMNSVSAGCFVRLGSRYEEHRVAGISHFLEHMFFKGTEKRSAVDIVRQIERSGGEFNAFTDREYTCYHVMVLKSELQDAAEILIDVILNSVFDAEEIERERKVILQEIAMVDESPEELAFDLFFEKVYGRKGLGQNILGSQSSVKRIRRLDLLKYVRNHYQPNQMVVSVCGDLDHRTVVKYFKPLTRMRNFHPRKNRKKSYSFAPARKIPGGRWRIHRDTEQAHIVMGLSSDKLASKDRYVVGLLNSYLGGGMSSLLFQEVREKNGLAYTVYSYVFPFMDSGLFTIYAGTGLNQVKRALGLVEDCLAKVCKSYLSVSDLDEVKESLKGSILMTSDDVESRMLSIGRNEMFLGAYFSPKEVCERIDRISVRDMRRVARKLFHNKPRSTLVLAPR